MPMFQPSCKKQHQTFYILKKIIKNFSQKLNNKRNCRNLQSFSIKLEDFPVDGSMPQVSE